MVRVEDDAALLTCGLRGLRGVNLARARDAFRLVAAEVVPVHPAKPGAYPAHSSTRQVLTLLCLSCSLRKT